MTYEVVTIINNSTFTYNITVISSVQLDFIENNGRICLVNNTKKYRVPPERCGGGIYTQRRSRRPCNQLKRMRQSIPMSDTASVMVRLPRLPFNYYATITLVGVENVRKRGNDRTNVYERRK